LIGILAPLLVYFGNPGNMGVCVACFVRDISGALGFHRANVVQYIRPEIVGFVIGSFLAAIACREFRPRCGSAPLVRFFLGMLSVMGALVFLGCPWRAYLRLSGGDLNAIWGILGLAAGIAIGIIFLRMGFSLGRNWPGPKALGWTMPVLMLILLALVIVAPQFGLMDGKPAGPIFFSTNGPGSQHAPIFLSLGIGILIGGLAQRSRFCTVGAIRDLILLRDAHLFYGILALVIAAFLTNLSLGCFNPSFANQPIAHTNALWNFGGMLLAGLAFTLAGGCPGRQLFLAGEGDGDAGVFILGMLVGAGISHNYSLASSPTGPGIYGPTIVVIGIVLCVLIGLTFRDPRQSN